MDTTTTLTGERTDLLEALAAQRYFLRFTVEGLTDEQARLRPTASELTLGGLVKHVAHQEAGWVRFVLEGPDSMPGPDDPEQVERWAEEFRMGPDETLEGLLAHYAEVAQRTDELGRRLLDQSAALSSLLRGPARPTPASRTARTEENEEVVA